MLAPKLVTTIQKNQDPEPANKRTRALYHAKGDSDDWIKKRMRSIAIGKGHRRM